MLHRPFAVNAHLQNVKVTLFHFLTRHLFAKRVVYRTKKQTVSNNLVKITIYRFYNGTPNDMLDIVVILMINSTKFKD